MRICIFILFAIMLVASGCGKAAPKQQAELNVDGLSVKEADTLLAQPTNEVNVPAPVEANIVVNKDAEPLIEKPVLAVVVAQSIPEASDDKAVQQALKNAHFYSGTIDGKIGYKTKEAIKEFQRKNKLVDDGKVGPKTWVILKTYLAQNSDAQSVQN